MPSGSGNSVTTSSELAPSRSFTNRGSKFTTAKDTIILDMQVIDPSKWVHDLDRFRCVLCVRKFNTFLRKHHCRTCGEIICSRCSRYRYVKVPNIGVSSVRSCLECIMRAKTIDPRHSAIHEEQNHRMSTISSHPTEADEWESIRSSHKYQDEKDSLSKDSISSNISQDVYSVKQNFPHPPSTEPAIEDAQYWPKAPINPHEDARLKALYSYEILDTAADPEFDAICELAARAFSCTVAAISFMDSTRQWFKSSVGIAQTELPREVSLCAHTLVGESPTAVTNLTEDPRFAANPLVSGGANIRFYASCAIYSADSQPIGTVLVLDTKPRASVSHRLLEVLTHLSSLVSKMLEDNKTENTFRESFLHERSTSVKADVSSATDKEEIVPSSPLVAPKETKVVAHSNAKKRLSKTDIPSVSTMLVPRENIMEQSVSENAIVQANAQKQMTAEMVQASNNRMEGIYMDLLCQVTGTQQLLAEQQGAMLTTLTNHGDRINNIEEVLKRIEGALYDRK